MLLGRRLFVADGAGFAMPEDDKAEKAAINAYKILRTEDPVKSESWELELEMKSRR